MKARLVTNDGCEKLVDAIMDSNGKPNSYYQTVSIVGSIYPYSGYGLPDAPITYKTHIYILVGYEYLITSKSGYKEPRAVYWEE